MTGDADGGGVHTRRRDQRRPRSPSVDTVLAGAGLNLTGEPVALHSVVAPIYQSSIFDRGDEHAGGAYGRRVNPNREVLEDVLASLEDAAAAVAFPSGMAAVHVALEAVRAERVLLPENVYGGIYELLSRHPRRERSLLELVDYRDASAFDAALARGAGVVWVESPSNPLLQVHDIAEVAALAHAHGAVVVVDNTLATPYAQRPLALGADVVVHSTSKYLGGHSDLIGGAVLTSDRATIDALRYYQQSAGLSPAPFDCWLTLRGLRTLAVRLTRQTDNALRLARAVHGHPRVRAVHYPGLAAGEEREVVRRQMSGFGAVVSLHLDGEDQALALLERLTRFHVAASLGGVESTVSHPATMSHRLLTQDGNSTLPAGLVRLSVGIEDPDDLIGDLVAALDEPSTPRPEG